MLATAIAIGVGSALFVRTLIFPDRPRAEVRHLVRSLRRASTSALDVVTDPGGYDLAILRRRLDRLGETALMIDDWLDRHDAAQSLSITSDESGAAGLRRPGRHGAGGESAQGARPGQAMAHRSGERDHLATNLSAGQPHPTTSCARLAKVPPPRRTAPICPSPRASPPWSRTERCRHTSRSTTSPPTRWAPPRPRAPSLRHRPMRRSRG